MNEYQIPPSNQFPSRWQYRNGLLTGFGKSIIVLCILNLPFLGTYLTIMRGEAQFDILWFLIPALGSLAFSVWVFVRIANLNYGFDEDGVYYNGIFAHARIPWSEIAEIDEVKEWNGLTPEDFGIMRISEPKHRYNIRIHGKNDIIRLARFEDPAVFLRDAVSSKTSIPAVFKGKTEIWDFLNG